MWKPMIIACVLALLAGCASLNNAGTAKYSVEPIITDSGQICCRVLVENGKEYAILKVRLTRFILTNLFLFLLGRDFHASCGVPVSTFRKILIR